MYAVAPRRQLPSLPLRIIRCIVALGPGDRLGVYEVADPIGQGGMGEVHRARDTALHRDAAIKILPPAWPAILTGSRASALAAVADASVDIWQSIHGYSYYQ